MSTLAPRSAVRALAARGWIELIDAPAAATRPAPAPAPARGGFDLNPEQRAAVDAVSGAFGRFCAFLLHGITGSGKTEVYLHLVGRALSAGGSALILVPEIGLTPQLIERFRARFAAPLAVLHSGLGERERLDAWRAAFTGEARIVLGTRSAVFAPLGSLSLIDRRRGARPFLQTARRRLSLFGARSCRGARAAGGRADRARLGDAGTRDALQRIRGTLSAPVAAAAHRPGAGAAPRAHRPAHERRALWHRRARHRGDRAASARRRPGARISQSPRLCADAAVHRVRLDRRLS